MTMTSELVLVLVLTPTITFAIGFIPMLLFLYLGDWLSND